MNEQKQLDLAALRKKIDELDGQLLGLLAERLNASRSAIEIKDASKSPQRDLDRERSIVINRIAEGRAHSLNPHFLSKIFGKCSRRETESNATTCRPSATPSPLRDLLELPSRESMEPILTLQVEISLHQRTLPARAGIRCSSATHRLRALFAL
jgi:chorismate mutase